jgi:hypothetical protein
MNRKADSRPWTKGIAFHHLRSDAALPRKRPSLCQSLCPLQSRRVKPKGAPGLAFETWDPSNQFPLETPTPLFVIPEPQTSSKPQPFPLSSRAADSRLRVGRSNDRLPVPATDDRVPHISLVFREMWDTTVLDGQLCRLSLGAYPDFLRSRSRRRPLMWFSLKRTTCSRPKPQLSTGNPGKPTCPGVPWRDLQSRGLSWKCRICLQTKLSSRPERSGVERSAVPNFSAGC